MNESILLARTAKRERMDVDNGQLWAEYRLVSAGFVGSGYWVEMRYIRSDGGIISAEEWKQWQCGTTPKAAVEEGMGDTAYEEAASLHLLHAEAVKQSRAIRFANDNAYKAQQAAIAAAKEVESYKFECNQEFYKKTKNMDESKAEACKKRMLKIRGPHMEELKARAAETKKVAEELAELAVKLSANNCR